MHGISWRSMRTLLLLLVLRNRVWVSGHIVYLNGTPLLWGSVKQTIVVDSSCSAEYVAASVACKQAIHAENIIGFLGFSCFKPYTMYTDSTACLNIASNSERLGNVRHLSIRYNLVRCYVSIGEIALRWSFVLQRKWLLTYGYWQK